jgi:2-polyprenyl-6-hydroxyphenyl methylase/3-demethylubiquinone-9 3-methyltransferase
MAYQGAHTMSASLTDVSTHYEFGANWKDYSDKIDEAAISQAEQGLLKLIAKDDIVNKSFLDIGSGSGLHSLAALRLGARSVVALDIDRNSVETTRATLEKNWAGGNVDVSLVSILAPEAAELGQFDIVYSWGVLHHTGAMWEAISRASDRVKPGGRFVLAIYRKTPLCWAWKIEKRIFTNGSKILRSLIRTSYISAFKLGLLARGRSAADYIDNYKGARGMNFFNDVDDWLGGYPYESATEAEIVAYMAGLGFAPELVVELHPKLGLFGTGCSEFRFRRDG